MDYNTGDDYTRPMVMFEQYEMLYPNVLKFRNYKKFSSERFINDILACDCIYIQVYMIQVGILVYSKPNGMSLKTFLLRSVIFMLHFTVVN